MILSFSVFREKIENGTKRQTIRKYSPKQYQRFLNCWKKRETTGRYNLFWHNPRNGGTRIADAVPSLMPMLIRFSKEFHSVVPVHLLNDGSFTDSPMAALVSANPHMLEDLALADGFNSFDELWQWFSKTYGDAMFTEKFMVLRWRDLLGSEISPSKSSQ